MKYTIVGAGAMGAYLGHFLALAGEEVYFVDPFEAHMKAIAEHGLTVQYEEKEAVNIKTIKTSTKAEGVGRSDVVLLMVKGLFTNSAVSSLKELADENTVIISLQNGYGNVEILKEHFHADQIAYGCVFSGAALVEPGTVCGDACTVHIGSESSENKGVLQKVLEAFEKGGAKGRYDEDIDHIVWHKLAINCANNALTALVRLDLSGLASDHNGVYISNCIAKEVQAVANAKGITLTEADLGLLKYAPYNGPSHAPSLFQDIMARKKTEIEFLNGAIMKEGEKAGIPTPFNTAIYYLIRVIEENYDKQY